MLIIRRPQLQCGKLEAVNQVDSKYAIGNNVDFFDCHKLQPDWIKHQSVHKGVVKSIYQKHLSVDTIYKIYFPHARCRKLIPENELERGVVRTELQCSWGRLESMSPDGMLIKVTKINALKPIIEEAVCCLRREVEEYLCFQRRLHITLKNDYVHLKISADKTGVEFRLFGKPIPYGQALSLE
ncbi:hypothetical protein ACQKP8_12150 [Photobacterium alginatilyticum]|uniref:hypothetical protein n=1 Tax=Photobacterium alginatilyticum TaxID=1775171 RepID=UPI004067F005